MALYEPSHLTFKIQRFAHKACVFCMELNINDDYCLGFYNRDSLCLLRGKAFIL